jgi:creatinine amidohydrolase
MNKSQAASPKKKHQLAEMTFVEFRDRIAGDPVILIPLGSQEEQGPMAPMGDFMLTQVIAGRVAEAAEAITAPILPFGYADYFRPVPGGIQLKPETFRAVLMDILENFLDHDLNRLVILNGHSGNYPLIDQTIRQVKRTRGVIVPCVNLWRLMTPAMWHDLHGDFGPAAFAHGGDPITSVSLHLLPELMRMDLITREEGKGKMIGLPTVGLAGVRFRDVEVAAPVDITDRCTNGIAGGDPTRSSAEIGRQITDYIVEYCTAFVRHFATIDPTTGNGEF